MAGMKNPVNMMITVDDGSRRIPIQNKQGEEIGSFTFHPTDIGIIDRYNSMADQFDAIVEPLQAVELTDDMSITDPTLVGALKEATTRLYAAVNELFGSDDAAEAFFGKMHPFSPVNGEFYCSQVLAQVGAFIGSQFDAETKALSKKARKYLK